MTQPRHQAHGLLDSPPDTVEPPWVAVAGGKGGVGKTLLAVNLAILAARAGRRTLLVDLDPGLANVDVHLRMAPRHTLDDLATGSCRAADAIAPGPGGVAVLAGRSGSESLLRPDHVQDTLDVVARAARAYDLVVCDTGAGIGHAVLETTRRAALTLCVTTPDPAAVTDAYATTKLLLSSGRPMPSLIVNRVRDRQQGIAVATRLSTVTEKFLHQSMPSLGSLRDSPDLARSVLSQQPLALGRRCQALDDLEALAAATLSRLPAAARRVPSHAHRATTVQVG